MKALAGEQFWVKEVVKFSFFEKTRKMVTRRTLTWVIWIGFSLLAAAIAGTRLFGVEEITLAISAFLLFAGLVLIDPVRDWARRRNLLNPTTIPSTYAVLTAAVIGAGGIASTYISSWATLPTTLGFVLIVWKELRNDIRSLESRIDEILRRLP